MASKGGNARRNARIAWFLGILLAVVVIGGGIYVFSAAGDGGGEKVNPEDEKPVEVEGVKYPQGVNSELFGKATSVSVAAFDQESSTRDQVATTGYLWVSKWDTTTGAYGEYTYGGTLSLAAASRTATTTPVVGDKVKLISFDSTYPYGDEVEFIVKQQAELKNLKVYNGSGSRSVTWFDEDGDAIANPTTSGNVSVGTTNYVFDKLRLSNTDDRTTIRPFLLGFDYAENTNISEIRASGLTAVSACAQPTRPADCLGFTGAAVKRLNLDDVYLWQPGDVNDANSKVETGSITIVPDGDDVASETVTAYIIDRAPFLNREDVLSYGVQDDATNPANVGLADISQAILLT